MSMFDIMHIATRMIVLGLLSVAVVTDLRSRIIPDWVSVGIVLVYALDAAAGRRFGEVPGDLMVAGLVFVAGLLVYLAGAVGGGDVKLTAALALWAGPAGISGFLVATAIAGGVLAAAMLAWSGLRPFVGGGRHAEGAGAAAPDASSRSGVPYAGAIAVGAVFLLAPGAWCGSAGGMGGLP